MAQLKDSLITGDLRVTGTIYGDANLSSLNANGTGLGTNGQILTSTGTGLAWSDNVAPSSHEHGQITNDGKIANNTAIATTDSIVYSDASDGNKLKKDSAKNVANALINSLDTGSSILTANDYVITQYVNGGTTTTTYHRRPASALRVGGLLTGRKLKVKLDSTTDVTFDGTADQTAIPVTGTLPVTNGGTGATSLADITVGKATADASGNTITTTYATKTEMNNLVAAADAMVFKGTLAGAATTTYTPAANCGDTYKVSTAGLINGERVEIGDILICTTDSTAAATSSNVSTVKTNWAIVQNNVDGAVFKSTNTFVDGRILVADGTTGKIKTSSYAPSSFAPWQVTTSKSTELYDFGFYVNQNNAAGTGPSGGNYFSVLNFPYRKATGNTKADWGWQIGGDTANNSRLFFRTTGDNVFGDWQEIAHAKRTGNNIGSATQPVYMSSTGVITAGTALKALAYKDSLTAADVGAATSDHVHGNITNVGELPTASAAVVTDANKKITAVDLSVSEPSASGSGITYIATISQNSQGQITATKSTVRDASDTLSGVVSTAAQTFAGNKTFKGHIYPQADSTYDIGSTTLHWRHQYLDDLYVSTDTGYTATNSAKIGTSLTSGYIDLTNTTPTIRFHRGTAAAVTGNIISDTYAAIHITGTAGTENTTYASRSIKPLVRIDGLIYGSSNIESAGYFMNNVSGTSNTGYYSYGNNVEYGRLYIETIGKAGTATTYTNPEDETQTVTGYTGNTSGTMTLVLGNNKAVGTNGTGYSSPGTAGTANNARGRLRIYSTNTKYIDIVAQTNGNRTVFLPNYGGDMYLIHASNNTAVGATDTPVYIATNGRVTALTGTIKNNTSGSAAKLTTAREIYVDLSTTRNTSSKVTFDGSADKAIHVNGTLPVARGGTGLTTASYKNAVVIGNSTTVTNAMQTVRTADGAFYATAQDAKPQFGTLPIGQGGTGTKTAPTAKGIIYANSTSAYASTTAGDSGQLLQSGGTSGPSWITATNANTGSTVVKRDANGNFSAGTITAALNGNANTATKWAAAQTVYVTLGTASTSTTIQGGSSTAETIGVNGTLNVANGGTGATSFTANSIIMSGSTTTAALTTRAVTNNTSNAAITNNNTNIPTMNTIYYGLVTVNGASQTRATDIYAPTGTGTAGQVLVSTGSTTKIPAWKTIQSATVDILSAAYDSTAEKITFSTTGQTVVTGVEA